MDDLWPFVSPTSFELKWDFLGSDVGFCVCEAEFEAYRTVFMQVWELSVTIAPANINKVETTVSHSSANTRVIC